MKLQLEKVSSLVSEVIKVGGAGYKVIMLLEGKADIYLYPRFSLFLIIDSQNKRFKKPKYRNFISYIDIINLKGRNEEMGYMCSRSNFKMCGWSNH